MPFAPPKPCPYPGCPILTHGGRCAQHAVQKEHARGNYDTRRLYRQAKWKQVRKQILDEQPLCVDCLKEDRVTVATEVHHKVKHGGDLVKFYDRANLEGLCATHHGIHTGRGE